MSKPKAILPCAGRGSRMGMPLDKSKELLPLYYGSPIIEYHLELCSIFQLEPHVITRKEKTDLIEYCEKKAITTQIIEPQGEWMDTVLTSKPYWSEDNILMLPDTLYTPISVFEHIKLGLQLGNNAVFAVHEVGDVSKWGSIDNYFITEKSVKTNKGMAWGIIGFKDTYGEQLFKGMSTRNSPMKLENVGFIGLSKFNDLTREVKKEDNETK